MWLSADFAVGPNRVQCQQRLVWHEMDQNKVSRLQRFNVFL